MKGLIYLIVFFAAAILLPEAVVGQEVAGKVRFGKVLESGDTIPLYVLHEVQIVESHEFLTDKEKRANKKLIRNVKKMLPYAEEGKRRLDELERDLGKMSKRERKRAIDAAEKKLRDDFEAELKKCTFSQGKVLIKLIDRETGRTSYKLVGQLKGSFRASFYQMFAKLFGLNLKTGYDPEHNKDDELMERVILAVKHGQV